MARVRRERGSVLIAVRRCRVRHALDAIKEEDVADTAVLVDAGAHVVDLSRGELVGQVGVGEQLAAHRDEIGCALGEHLFGVLRFESSECDHRQVRCRFDCRGEMHQVAGGVGRVAIGDPHRDHRVAIRAHMDRGSTGAFGHRDHGDCVIEGGAAGGVRFVGIQPHPHRHGIVRAFPDRADDLGQEPSAVDQRSAPGIGARVLGGGEEPVDEVAVAGVEFDAVKSRSDTPRRRRGEPLDCVFDVGLGCRVHLVARRRRHERLHHRRALFGGDHHRQRVGDATLGDCRHE